MVNLKKVAIGLFFLPGFLSAAVSVPECSEKHPAVMVTTGESVFDVRLVSNPTTGYRWFLQSAAEGVTPISAEFVAPARHDLVGAPGEEIWHFKVLPTTVARQFNVSLVYARPFEKSGSKQPFSCQVSVLPSP